MTKQQTKAHLFKIIEDQDRHIKDLRKVIRDMEEITRRVFIDQTELANAKRQAGEAMAGIADLKHKFELLGGEAAIRSLSDNLATAAVEAITNALVPVKRRRR